MKELLQKLHACLEFPELYDRLSAELGDGLSYSIFLRDDQSGDLYLEYSSTGNAGMSSSRDSDKALLTALEMEGPFVESFDAIDGAKPVCFSHPLRFRGEAYGVFCVHADREAEIPEAWALMAEALGIQIVRLQLYESANNEAATSASKLDALNETGELLRDTDLEILLVKLLELSLQIVNAQVGSVCLRDEMGAWESPVEWGLTFGTLRELKSNDVTTSGFHPMLIDQVLDSGKSLLVNDVSQSTDVLLGEMEGRVSSLLCIPLETKSRKIGVITIVNSDEQGFDSRNFEILSTVSNLASIAVENALLYKRAVEAERLREQMEVARNIQSMILPRQAPEMDACEISGWSLACDETGGDYYDYKSLDGKRLGFVVGDASGHGIGAALMMFRVRATFNALLEAIEDIPELFYKMNNLIHTDSEEERFMTFFFGLLDMETRTFFYNSAGHDAPFLFRRSESQFVDLDSTGLPIGMMNDMDFPNSDQIQVQPGDLLLMGTDGVWECMNENNEEYGKERLKRLMLNHADEPTDELLQHIRRDLLEFRGNAQQRDDITLLAVKFH